MEPHGSSLRKDNRVKKIIGIMASVALAGALVAPTSSSTAAELSLTGMTAMRVNITVTEALLKANVTVNGQDPAGSTITAPGRLALEFPVSGTNQSKISHTGALFLSHYGTKGWRTVVIDNLVADVDRGTLKGRVYATDTDLGTFTIFKLTNVKAGTSQTSYTINLGSGVADALNSALGTRVFKSGMRIGVGETTLNS
jgi:hypothetical protein